MGKSKSKSKAQRKSQSNPEHDPAALRISLGKRGLLEKCEKIARTRGVILDEVLDRGGGRSNSRCRRAIWLMLRSEPYCFTLNEIAKLWGVDHSNIIVGVRKAATEADSAP